MKYLGRVSYVAGNLTMVFVKICLSKMLFLNVLPKHPIPTSFFKFRTLGVIVKTHVNRMLLVTGFGTLGSVTMVTWSGLPKTFIDILVISSLYIEKNFKITLCQ